MGLSKWTDSYLAYDEYLVSPYMLGYKEEGNKNMKNKFNVTRVHCLNFETYEEAEIAAKQYTAKNDEPYAVMQAVSMTKVVVPAIEVVKL